MLLTPWARSVLFLNTRGNLLSRFEQTEGQQKDWWNCISNIKDDHQLFCAEKRPEIKLTYTTFGDVSKELARQWSDIKDKEERKYYEDLANAQKEVQEV